jgi:RNA polymerase-binding transcription factor DksA
MPALTPEQKQQVQNTLSSRHTELRNEIRAELERSGHEHFADLAGEVADAGDASVADMLIDHDIAIVRRQVEELMLVETAQKRVESEDFGACEECGADIGLPRLLVVPHATRCIGCQGQHEKMFAHESTPKL